MRKLLLCGGYVVSATCVFAVPALAQDVTERRLPTREQIELPRTDAPRPQGQARVRGYTPREPCPFETSAVSVDLRSVRFSAAGGGVLPPVIEAVLTQVRPSPGPQPVSNLCSLRDAANQRLSDAGYIASVQIPPQEITTGDANLEVTLARLVNVQVQGSPGPYGATLAPRIAQLKALYPLNRLEAERILLVAGDVPGLDVALSLRPAGSRPGEVIGDLVVRYVPWAIVANVQNSGSRFIGRESGTLRAEYFGLTGLSDRTFVGVSATSDFEEQVAIQGGHYFGDSRGNTAGVQLSRAWSRPDIGVLDLRSRSTIVGLDLATPLVRSVTQSLNLGGGFELINQRVKFHADGGGLPLTRDKLRVVFARLSGSLREPRFSGPDRFSLGGSIELRRGVDLFDATTRGELTSEGYTPSRIQGDPSATVLRGGVDGSVGVGMLSLGGIAQGQWADNPLLSIEEFSVGNLTIGRGYDPGVTSGDRAFGFRIEPRVSLPISPSMGTQLFAFYDNVRVWNLDNFTTENRRSLRSLGAGARISLPGKLLLEVMYARPRDRGLATDAKRASDRFLVSLTTQLSPSPGR